MKTLRKLLTIVTTIALLFVFGCADIADTYGANENMNEQGSAELTPDDARSIDWFDIDDSDNFGRGGLAYNTIMFQTIDFYDYIGWDGHAIAVHDIEAIIKAAEEAAARNGFDPYDRTGDPIEVPPPRPEFPNDVRTQIENTLTIRDNTTHRGTPVITNKNQAAALAFALLDEQSDRFPNDFELWEVLHDPDLNIWLFIYKHVQYRRSIMSFHPDYEGAPFYFNEPGINIIMDGNTGEEIGYWAPQW